MRESWRGRIGSGVDEWEFAGVAEDVGVAIAGVGRDFEVWFCGESVEEGGR
jgi:hypothetical protein